MPRSSGQVEPSFKGLDRHGEEQTIEATGLLARAFQHEMDHLDGLVFIDRLRGIKRDLIVRQDPEAKQDREVVKPPFASSISARRRLPCRRSRRCSPRNIASWPSSRNPIVRRDEGIISMRRQRGRLRRHMAFPSCSRCGSVTRPF